MKEKLLDKDDIVGFLGEGTEFDGKVTYKGTLRLDGKFKGIINSDSSLVVGETAQIDGEINVSQVTVSGKVVGIIRAKDRLEIFSKARVSADIFTSCLIIEEGAIFQGKCNMEALKPAESLIKKPFSNRYALTKKGVT